MQNLKERSFFEVFEKNQDVFYRDPKAFFSKINVHYSKCFWNIKTKHDSKMNWGDSLSATLTSAHSDFLKWRILLGLWEDSQPSQKCVWFFFRLFPALWCQMYHRIPNLCCYKHDRWVLHVPRRAVINLNRTRTWKPHHFFSKTFCGPKFWKWFIVKFFYN